LNSPECDGIEKNQFGKKSRKFVDVKGERKTKLADNIFNQQHNFSAPIENGG
jgi:hypothetical protein